MFSEWYNWYLSEPQTEIILLRVSTCTLRLVTCTLSEKRLASGSLVAKKVVND